MNDPFHQNEGHTLTDHLSELRDRLIRSALAVAVATALCWYFHEQLFGLIRAPIAPFLPNGLTYLSPADKFVVSMKVGVLGGVVLACPVWIYQLWMFIAPGLYTNEKRYTLTFIFAGSALFVVGVLFAYFFAIPSALEFFLTWGGAADQPSITLTEYMSFFMTFALVFGGAFELPLIIVLLGAIGLVNQKMLRDKRRFAIVGLSFLAAILTPPDVLSMGMLLIPLWALYELSIILVGFVSKPKPDLAE